MALLSIGTELTRGELVDSNAAWLSDQLTSLGYEVCEKVTVADDVTRIAKALTRLASEASLVVATGGLGPTTDDLTTAAVARGCGVPLRRDAAVYEHMKRRYESRGRELLETNAKQADFPEGAFVLPNPEGTAPGFEVALGESRCFFLPGVPREMKPMFLESVCPRIGGRVRDAHQIHVRTFGLPESEVGRLLEGLEEEGITLGYRASFPEIEVKVLSRAATEAEATERGLAVAKVVRERLGDFVYGDRDDTFPAVVGGALRDRGMTLSVAESCTGGLIGAMLTAVAGSSEYLLMDAVTYANSAKTQVLGVEVDVLRGYGAVSAECAASMAEGARRVGGSDIAVATTGIAGPGGGTDDKPVGTVWFGLASEEGTLTLRHLLPGDREQVRTRAAYIALDLVRRAVSGRDVECHDTLKEVRR